MASLPELVEEMVLVPDLPRDVVVEPRRWASSLRRRNRVPSARMLPYIPTRKIETPMYGMYGAIVRTSGDEGVENAPNPAGVLPYPNSQPARQLEFM